MLEEIEYWKPETLLRYIEDEIIPLNILAHEVSKDFKDLDPELSKYAYKIHELTENIIVLTKNIFGKDFPEQEIKKPSDIYELLEIGRRFLEKAFNITVGAHPYTFFVWSLRKITKAYLKEHYPMLKDCNIFSQISSILGLETILTPPKIEPRELFEDYILYGYPDYHVKYNQPVNNTIGGEVCRLNVLIWKMSKDNNIKSYNTIYQKQNLYKNYKEKITELLKSINWNSEPITYYSRNTLFSIDGFIVEIWGQNYYPYKKTIEYRGKLIEIEDYEIKDFQQLFTLFNFLDWVMPPQILGLWELEIDPFEKRGRILNIDDEL